MTDIGNDAFAYCSSLTSITIPASVTSIEGLVFEWCSSLENIEIPVSVTTIGWGAFFECNSLTDVYYTGREQDKNGIDIGNENDWLLNATWHYNEEQHTMIKYDATAPTSTEPGNTEYYYCQTCGKYFSDEAGTIEIEKDSWNIPATGEKNEDVIGPTSPKTGDQSNSILWISLLGVAALLAVGAVFVRRKNRKNNE